MLDRGSFLLGNSIVTAAAIDPSWPQEMSSCAVRVDGFNKQHVPSETTLRELFENRILTGGDRVEHLEIVDEEKENCFAVIVYNSNQG